MTLRASEGAVVECGAALIGPGGAALTTRGTRAAPLRLDVGAYDARDEPPGDAPLPFVLAGVGVGVAAVVAAVLVFFLAPPSTAITPPSL